MKEVRAVGVVLRKQELKEMDEIITFYFKDLGKVRAKAVSLKKSTSRLLGFLQQGFEVEVRLVGKEHLPVIASSKVLAVHKGIWENVERSAFFYWISEIYVKATPDAVSDKGLYELLLKILKVLDELDTDEKSIKVLFCYTSIRLLSYLGFGIRIPKTIPQLPVFSYTRGGIFSRDEVEDPLLVSNDFVSLLISLNEANSENLPEETESVDEVKDTLTKYLSIQIERIINSARFVV